MKYDFDGQTDLVLLSYLKTRNLKLWVERKNAYKIKYPYTINGCDDDYYDK